MWNNSLTYGNYLFYILIIGIPFAISTLFINYATLTVSNHGILTLNNYFTVIFSLLYELIFTRKIPTIIEGVGAMTLMICLYKIFYKKNDLELMIIMYI